eukprot:scaffold18.g1959.t1
MPCPTSRRCPFSNGRMPHSRVMQSETLRLPLDYYKLLGVPAVASRDSITTAFDRRLNQPPPLGYTQATLLGRGTTLKGVLQTLAEPEARRGYDERLQQGQVYEDVPDKFVPGVLALLQESGDSQTAVAAGEQWLSTHRNDPGARDVALTTALAHCSVASLYMDRKGDVLSVVRMLEVARELLRAHRVGGELQAEVAERVEGLQPALACELVALPLERFQERERGIALAQSLLAGGSTPAARKGMAKQAFLDRLGKALTAGETVQLYEVAGRSLAESPSELYDVAVAHIAEAAASAKPGLLVKALAALAAAGAAAPRAAGAAEEAGFKQAAERRAQEERSRRAVAACVCHLLLGETEAARAALGLSHAGAGDAGLLCDRSVLGFIKDLLPGLCVLAQKWVSDVALCSYRGSAPGGFTLDAWFQDGSVQRDLELREQGLSLESASGGPFYAAAAAVAAPVLAGLGSLLAPFGLLARSGAPRTAAPVQGAAPGTEAAPAAAPSVGSASPAVAVRGAGGVVDEASAPNMSTVDFRQARKSRQLPPRHTARPASPAAAPAAATAASPAQQSPEAVAAKAPSQPAPPRQDRPRQAAAEAAAAILPSATDASADFLTVQPLADLTPLTGEERMWDSYEARSVRWGRVLGLAAVLAGAAFLGGRAWVAQQQQPAAATAAAAHGEQPAAAQLSRAEAAALIQQWQMVKAEALGPSHAVGRLSSVLGGELLQQWRERAESVRERGWHYAHSLESSRVDGLAVDAAAGTATVRTVLCERVEAHRAGEAAPQQSFRSEYVCDYALQRQGDSWVLVGAEVQQ